MNFHDNDGRKENQGYPVCEYYWQFSDYQTVHEPECHSGDQQQEHSVTDIMCVTGFVGLPHLGKEGNRRAECCDISGCVEKIHDTV